MRHIPQVIYRLICALFLVLIIPGAVWATESNEAPPNAGTARKILSRLAEGVERFTLSNGMRVVLFNRPQAPVFTGHIWVKVGGVDEKPGVTGVAHLLEHMAFKGSTTIGTKDYEKEAPLLEEYDRLVRSLEEADGDESETLRSRLEEVTKELQELWLDNEFSMLYQKNGAVGLNAATGKDYTYYMVSLPNTSFKLWAWLESDRLLNPVFRQFYKEREVVMEERRMRTDDNPGGKLYESLLATAFLAHPNRLPVIGWPSDLANLHISDIEEMYNDYYRPENMVIGLVGDLEAKEVKSILEQYFGRLPRAEGSVPEVVTTEPPQRGARTAVVRFDAQPMFAMAFHKPVWPHKDDMYFAVVHSLLAEGRSSILYRELVQRRQLAASIATSEAPGERFPSLFYVWATPRNGVSNETLIKEVQELLDRLKTELVSQEDLDAAKKRVRVGMLNSMNSNSGLARTLAHAELLWGNWEVLFEMYDLILSTTAEDVQRVAQTYFNTENRTVVKLEKEVAAGATQAAVQKPSVEQGGAK